MLGIWDRLFGTWCEPAVGVVLTSDVPSVARTHDGVAAQFGLVAELAFRRGQAEESAHPQRVGSHTVDG